MTDTEGPRFDDNTGELLSRMDRWDRLLTSHWSNWIKDSRECYEFVAGRQWTDEERGIFEEDNRIVATVNRIETTIDAVSGAEIMGRQEVTYLPRTVEDTGPTDVLSQGAQYVRQGCDAEDEESEAFRDCIICGIGNTESRPDYSEDMDGQIVIERVDPLRLLWDPSSRKANFADARYVRHSEVMSREAAKEAFPEVDVFDAPDNTDATGPAVVDPRRDYEDDRAHQALSDDEVEIKRYQWFEEVPVLRASLNGQVVEIQEEEYDQAVAMGAEVVRQKRRRYVGSSRVDLQACKLEYSIVSPK